jgi:hypothetical protein
MADEKKVETKVEDKGAPKNGVEKKPAEKVEPKAEPKADEKEGQSEADDKGGELANVFAEDSKDKGEKKPEPKAGDLKLSIPDDLKDLVGKVEDYLGAAREEGLTQKQLDRFMAVHFDRVKAAAQEADSAKERGRLETRRELMSDPKLGGQNLAQTMQVAERGARALGGSALAVALARHLKGEETIPGPALVRAFHMAGLEMNEDRLGGPGEKGKGKDADANLTPLEREFKHAAPETWKRMQAEKNKRAG